MKKKNASGLRKRKLKGFVWKKKPRLSVSDKRKKKLKDSGWRRKRLSAKDKKKRRLRDFVKKRKRPKHSGKRKKPLRLKPKQRQLLLNKRHKKWSMPKKNHLWKKKTLMKSLLLMRVNLQKMKMKVLQILMVEKWALKGVFSIRSIS